MLDFLNIGFPDDDRKVQWQVRRPHRPVREFRVDQVGFLLPIAFDV